MTRRRITNPRIYRRLTPSNDVLDCQFCIRSKFGVKYRGATVSMRLMLVIPFPSYKGASPRGPREQLPAFATVVR